MSKHNCPDCPQSRRALRLLLDPNRPKIDQKKLIESLPGPTPFAKDELIDLIIQIVLALLENKDKDDEPGPSPPDDVFAELRRVATTTAIETIKHDILLRDIPKLVASIQDTAARIPSPGFSSPREAREMMRISNNQTLGESATNWKLWNAAIRSEMDDLSFDDNLTELSDYKKAWTAISQALTVLKLRARVIFP